MKLPTPPTPEFEDVFQKILADERARTGQSSHYGESMLAPALRLMAECQRAEAFMLSRGFDAEIVDEELMNTTTASDMDKPITIEQLNQTILELQAKQQENPIIASIICPLAYFTRVRAAAASQIPKACTPDAPIYFDSVPIHTYANDAEFRSALNLYAEKWVLMIYPDGSSHKIQLTPNRSASVYSTYCARKPLRLRG